MANDKKVTVDQLSSVATAITEKSDARFRKSADKLAKDDLTDTLKTEINGKAAASDVYAKTETYTKTEVDSAISAQIGKVYKPAGNKAAADLTAALLVAANLGNVYNTTDTLTITDENKDLFVDGAAGKSYGPGADVAIVDTDTTGENPVYKFNVLPGFIDLSGYATKEDAEAASAADIQAIIDGLYPSSTEPDTDPESNGD